MQESEDARELGDDSAESEAQRWSAQSYTLRFRKGAHQQAMKELSTLIGAAATSTDPKVAAAHGRYTQQKALCDVLAKAEKGRDASSGLP